AQRSATPTSEFSELNMAAQAVGGRSCTLGTDIAPVAWVLLKRLRDRRRSRCMLLLGRTLSSISTLAARHAVCCCLPVALAGRSERTLKEKLMPTLSGLKV